VIKLLKAVFLAVLFILGITFSTENTSSVVLRYYFGLESPPMPLFLLVLFTILLGIILAGAFFILDEVSLKRALWERERRIGLLESELKTYQERDGEKIGVES
jgi:uncharacterized membrane protein YciS (DUF1049 family)